MKKSSSKNNGVINTFSYSILKLYNDSFLVAVPLVLLFAIVQLVFMKNTENGIILCVLLASLLFFRVFRNNKIVVAHQVYFHQVFVFTCVLVAIAWFISFGRTRELVYLLFIGSAATYLYIEQKTILFYFISYHLFLYVLSLYFPALKLNYVLYSLMFSSAAIFVCRWLNQLLTNSYELYVSEKRLKVLFEQGNSAVFLLKNGNDYFEIFDTNETCEELFGFRKKELIELHFENLLGESDEKKEALFQKIKGLKNHEKFIFTGTFKRKNEALFFAETTFVSVELKEEKIIQVFVHDITEKRENELKISESVQTFRNIVDNSPISIFIFTENQLVYKNSKAELIFNEHLDNSKTDLFEIFPKTQKHLLSELIGEESNKPSSYTEIAFGDEPNKNLLESEEDASDEERE